MFVVRRFASAGFSGSKVSRNVHPLCGVAAERNKFEMEEKKRPTKCIGHLGILKTFPHAGHFVVHVHVHDRMRKTVDSTFPNMLATQSQRQKEQQPLPKLPPSERVNKNPGPAQSIIMIEDVW